MRKLESPVRLGLHHMCLQLKIHLASSDAAQATALCRDSASPAIRLDRPSFGIVRIAGPDGGCACSLLADSADWNAPTWDLLPEMLPKLTASLRSIRRATTTGFRFEASLVGESPDKELNVTIDELTRLVEQNRLETKARYAVQ